MLLKILAIVGMQLILSSCYTLSQALHFNDLYNSRVDISEVLADEDLPENLREQLLWSRGVIDFAGQEGLDVDGAYRYYIHTDQPAVSFLVQAAHADSLQWVSWWFPVVGRVPYLGFFDIDQRDAQAELLAQKSYDVATGQVGAFSSLGWFEDPIYRPMLLRPSEELAHLLFHELIHRSLWVRGQVEFNENLAEFGAMILTERLLAERQMQKSWQLYQQRRLDREDYRLWLRDLRKELESVYQDDGLSRAEKLARKDEIFDSFVKEKLPIFRTAGFDFVKHQRWNNAYVMGSSLYAPDYSRFELAFNCVGQPTLGEFLAQLQLALKKVRNKPFAALDQLCQ